DGKGFVGLGGLLIRPQGAPDAEVATGDQRVYSLERTAAGWRVSGPGRPSFVVTGAAGLAIADGSGLPVFGNRPSELPQSYASALKAGPSSADGMLPLTPDCPTEPSPWRALQVGDAPVSAVARADDGRIAAGDESGRGVVFDAAGEKLRSVSEESAILSLHFLGDELLVGEDRGALSSRALDGSTGWQVVIPYEPMPWDYWSEYRSRVREITSADIDGDGVEEILISNSDRRVYAFDDDRTQLWRAPVEWGIFTAMTAGEFMGEFGLFGGTSQPSIHGRCTVFGPDGRVVKHIARSDLVSWSVPSQFRDMRLSDIDGDGEDEIINAVDTNCRQLVVYGQDRSVKWDADVAGAANCIALDDDGQAVYCGSESGYVHAFEGPTGERRWSTWVGEPVQLLARTGDRLAAVTHSPNVYLLEADGTLVGRVELPAAVSAVNRPGDHRVGDPLLLGTENGLVISDR
ncbi:MAG: PQQ-binding-like beta-propeller repeat protein, partial [Armatimonadia bacterium]|nr:PQQ-binding-like beta-propeller repeat protein [Armatimonadia bacterium]